MAAKEKKKKLKMSMLKFKLITIPILVFFLVIVLVVNFATNMLASTLDTYFGAGTQSINAPANSNEINSKYYTVNDEDAESAKESAYKVAKRVSEEGSILLKNNGVLPLQKKSKVTPFGYAYLNPIYGQLTSGGSAKWVKNPITPKQGLSDFTINTNTEEAMNSANVEPLLEKEGAKPAGVADSVLGGDCKIYEYDSSIYSAIEKEEDSTGIVFITRSGQEGQDQKYDAYSDGTPHYLALSENEKGAIAAAKEKCGKVVVVIVGSAAMELGPIMSGELEADAILYVGHPGERGLSTLSSLLDGDVNPSGKTVDTYVRDFTKDPSYVNLGDFKYSNYNAKRGAMLGKSISEIPGSYIEYQEGVYMGYRYWETADDVDDEFVYGELDGKGACTKEGAVCYPFGYGLSYTTFDKKLTSLEKNGEQITAKVLVKNTGNRSGKEVVELYNTSPVTSYDAENKIEKPSVNLVAFAKTELLESGQEQELTLNFATDDLTSYSYTHDNGNGTLGCYMLEAGNYQISLRSDSHNVIESKDLSINDTIFYDGSDEAHIRTSEKDAQSKLDDEGNPTGVADNKEGKFKAATNEFQTSTDYMNEESLILSRYDWKNTQPKGTPGHAKELDKKFAEKLDLETSFDVNTDKELGNVEGSKVYAASAPTQGAKNNIVASSMRGVPYNDSKWESFLDQIDFDADKDDIIKIFAGAAYNTAKVDSLALPSTVEPDGANGIKVKGSDSGYDMNASSSFGFAPLMASTWDVDLLYEVGASFGQESLHHGINGWYCPAINLHRSQFSGRVFEYYSEDPILSGKLAAHAISGSGDQGLFAYLKHFALNDTETNRDKLANFWADEQTMRELYLKSFEIAVKEGKMTVKYTDENGQMASKVMRASTAIMPAQNRVGTIVGECNYSLIQHVLRGEWGFKGMLVTDYWMWGPDNIRDLCIRSGCDSYLAMYFKGMVSVEDYDSSTARSAMRDALHNVAYTVVNSNVMQGAAPGATFSTSPAPWQVLVTVLNVVTVLIVAGYIFLLYRRHKKVLANPDAYKQKKKKK